MGECDHSSAGSPPTAATRRCEDNPGRAARHRRTSTKVDPIDLLYLFVPEQDGPFGGNASDRTLILRILECRDSQHTAIARFILPPAADSLSQRLFHVQKQQKAPRPKPRRLDHVRSILGEYPQCPIKSVSLYLRCASKPFPAACASPSGFSTIGWLSMSPLCPAP